LIHSVIIDFPLTASEKFINKTANQTKLFAFNSQNQNRMKNLKILIGIITTQLLLHSCATKQNIQEEIPVITTVPGVTSTGLEIEFVKGDKHNHPSFAIWVEDMEGNYIETLFVTQFVGTGKYRFSTIEPGKWKNDMGEARRPASLPYWSHKRNIKAEDGLYIPSVKNPVPDAITGATPKGNFNLETGTKIKPGEKFRVLLEINQPWDSNETWSNDKFPGDLDYFGSLQPALVYAVTIDPKCPEKEFYLNPVGHSHPSGKDGNLYTDLTTLTTAKKIAQKIVVRLK
jgi:hypothetical protein